MTTQKPSVGRIVHYVSHGTPVLADGTQAYTSECRAAVITAVRPAPMVGGVSGHENVDLCVLNPTGLFFNQDCPHAEPVDGTAPAGGSWHWPERVEG